MGKRQKAGKKGYAVNYITRNQAIKRLQITLKDFRRLCILKGIYPRDPKKKVHGKDKTYYHVKDIKFLMHEPLLDKFRAFKTFMKKYKKAITRRDYSKAKSLKENQPQMKVDHLVKERYPTFSDAVRDMDDPLCMVYLFAALPSKIIKSHTPERAAQCHRLCMEFSNLVFRTKALRKVFVSIKGYYYQAEIMGENVTWLVPHKFSQLLPSDVDYRVMLTFLEFYSTMIKFVNFKLYHDSELHYPPTLDAGKDSARLGLTALDVISVDEAEKQSGDGDVSDMDDDEADADADAELEAQLKQKLAEMGEEDEDDEDDSAMKEEMAARKAEEAAKKAEQIDDFSGLGSSGKKKNDTDSDAVALNGNNLLSGNHEVGSLFKGLTFLVCREVPQEPLEFVIRCGGGEVLLETSYTLKQQQEQEQAQKQNKGKGKGKGKNTDNNETDIADNDAITHQVVDRSKPKGGVRSGREYIQPQWIFDSFNARVLLPYDAYGPGVVLPAHLSPFIDNEKEGYVPEQAYKLSEWGAKEGGSERAADALAKDAEKEGDEGKSLESEYNKGLAKEAAGYQEEDSDDDEEEDEEAGDNEGDSDDDDEEEVPAKKKVDENDPTELAKIMMPKKNKRMYSRIQHTLAKKDAVNQKLTSKRKTLEKETRRAKKQRK